MDAKRRCPFRSLVVEVTDRCNNACLHCYNHWRGGPRGGRARDLLTREDIRFLVGKVRRDAPITQVALSGGEPLLHPDLPEIAGDLAGMGLATVVITNGVLLDTSCLKRFPADSVFEITLFSADESLHNQMAGKRVFERVLENLIRLRRKGHRFLLACVITRLNWHDVTRTIKLGVALGAEAVLFNRINLSRRVYSAAPHLAPTTTQLKRSLGAANSLAAKHGIPIAVSVPIPPCLVDPGDYPGLNFGWCPRGGENAYYTIGSSGHLRPCNHSGKILGDLRMRDFAEIAGSRDARGFWKPVPRECRLCGHALKDRCRGGCPAAADECFGSRTRIDPFVELRRGGPHGRRTAPDPGHCRSREAM